MTSRDIRNELRKVEKAVWGKAWPLEYKERYGSDKMVLDDLPIENLWAMLCEARAVLAA